MWQRIVALTGGLIVLLMLGAGASVAETSDADLIKQGQEALKAQNYDKAITKFSEAVRLDPEDAGAWGRRCEAYSYKHDPHRAISDCDHAIKMTPQDPKAWSARCFAHAFSENYTDALTDCSQAIKLGPHSAQAYSRRAQIYSYKADYSDAIADSTMAIGLDPNSASGFSERGYAYLRLGQIDNAIANYNDALRRDPFDSGTYVRRGDAWFAKGEYERAWRDYDKAIKLDPKSAYAYATRGDAAAALYDYDAAIADYQQASRIDPNYPRINALIEGAEQHKRDILVGQIGLGLFGVGMLAMLYLAFRTYRSPTAFSHSIERRFVRIADGKLIFHPPPWGPGYVVPDAEKEDALRIFARHWMAVGLALPVVLMTVSVGLLFLVIPVFSSLSQNWDWSSPGWPSLIYGWATVSMLMGGIFVGLRQWRRAAMRGMVKSGHKQKRPPSSQWVSDFARDTPVVVRRFVVVLSAFIFFESVAGIWRSRYELSPVEIRRMPPLQWMLLASQFMCVALFGWYLILMLRQWQSAKSDRPQQEPN